MKKPLNLPETDLCVMCGMCLPLCPTYQLHQNEAESPRGRIALMQAIDRQQIKADKNALQHIDHCLGCLNCETICPSRVPYGKLIDNFRNQYRSSIHKPFISQQILKQSTKTNGLEKMAELAQKPVFRQLNNLFKKVPGQLSDSRQALDNFYPASSPRYGAVSLFSGCSGRSTDITTIRDAAFLLNRLGYDVHIPEEQHCCGAMHQHNGQLDTASKLLEKVKSQSVKPEISALLFFSPACGASLQQLNDFRIQDVRLFILATLQQQPLSFSSTRQPIALHESCSHQNMLKLKSLNRELLSYIPGIQLIESKQPSLCCGAGGLQYINYPQQADLLRDKKLDSFDLSNTRILLSDNIGCSLHMKTGISAYNSEIEILHPISFLARQLINPEDE